jgi:hypothetical protein
VSAPPMTMQAAIEAPTVAVLPNEVSDMFVRHPPPPTRPLSKVGTAAMGLVVLDLAMASSHLFLASRLCALVLVVLLPGVTITGALRVRLESRVSQFALIVGAGLACLMGWALLASVVLPHLGVPRPLEPLPLAVAINAIVIAAAFASPNASDPVLELIEGHWSRSSVLVAAGCIILPLAGVAGVERVNDGRGGTMVVVVVLVTLLLLGVSIWKAGLWSDSRVQLMLFSAGLTLVYLYTYRSNHLFGSDIQREFQRFSVIANAGRWTLPTNGDPYGAMLSITALPTVLVKTSGLSGLYVFKGFYPLLLAAVPPLTYGFARRWVPARPAMIATVYLIVLSQFAQQLSSIARQEVALFYFVLLFVVLFDAGVRTRKRTMVAIAVLGAMVVSHYTTSYISVIVLATTWVAFGVVRLVRRVHAGSWSSRPVINLPLVLSGIAMILIWDVGLTASTGNASMFMTAFEQQGPDILPHFGGSILHAWLDGNVAQAISPSSFYRLAKHVSLTSQPWLNHYAAALTARYPAASAPVQPRDGLGHGAALNGLSQASTAMAELFLLIVVVGTAVALLRRRRSPVPFAVFYNRTRAQIQASMRRFRSGVPLEVAVLELAVLGFLALIRVSGTLAVFYNQSRAQIQAGIVLSVGFAVAMKWLISRIGALATVGAAVGLLLVGVYSTGLADQLGNGGSVLFDNSGAGYNAFYMTDQETAASKWLVNTAGPKPLIWTDEYGQLRIWAGTSYTGGPLTDLTPATIDQGAWVFATGYNISGWAYGSIDDKTATYQFPTNFLEHAKNLVYSSPGARVYR